MRIEDPDDALVQAVARLDSAAVRSFLRKYDGLICASVVQGGYFIPDQRDEEQLQNDIRKAVIESIETWNRKKGRFSTWVYAIARNVVNGFLREHQHGLETGKYGDEVSYEDGEVRRRDDADPEDADEGTNPFDSVSTVEAESDSAPLSPLLRAFFAATDELIPDDREVLEHILRADPHRKLAIRLGISEDYAKVRVSRLKQRLRIAILTKLKDS